jgi:glucose-6-phosphate isomerase
MHKDAVSTMSWQELSRLCAGSLPSIQALFAEDSSRSLDFIRSGAGLVLDFSRQRISRPVLDQLARMADELELRSRIQRMYEGALCNPTENRQVLHTALRRASAPHAGLVAQERARVLRFAEDVREGRIRGSGGEVFELVVNIGIGGSDLGPAMAVEALRPYGSGAPKVAFVSNVDGCRLSDVLAGANPRRTLFIVCSKTLTTQETLANASVARRWLSDALGVSAVPGHFAAVSVNAGAMDAFGIHPDYRFAIWDWVGGRYSIWSAVGLALAIFIGADYFKQFLAGGAGMDEHFLRAPWHQNLPALAGLAGVWNINFLKLPTLAVLPYDDRLARFPAYLQQLEMESNGKAVRLDGSSVRCETAPVIWGEPGNNAQHSFFQMLHQGTPRAALDFVLPALSSCGNRKGHDLAVANCLAQAEAFAFGQRSDDPHKVHDGNRPSSILMFRELSPKTLGALVAYYEHKTFTQSVCWGINAFDQWGVELGKKLATTIAPLVEGEGEAGGACLQGTLRTLRTLRSGD